MVIDEYYPLASVLFILLVFIDLSARKPCSHNWWVEIKRIWLEQSFDYQTHSEIYTKNHTMIFRLRSIFNHLPTAKNKELETTYLICKRVGHLIHSVNINISTIFGMSLCLEPKRFYTVKQCAKVRIGLWGERGVSKVEDRQLWKIRISKITKPNDFRKEGIYIYIHLPYIYGSKGIWKLTPFKVLVTRIALEIICISWGYEYHVFSIMRHWIWRQESVLLSDFIIESRLNESMDLIIRERKWGRHITLCVNI